VDLPGTIPDGVAFDTGGTLYISLYRPDAILTLADGVVRTFAEDPWGLPQCAPTNICFHDEIGMLVSANLCSRHLTGMPVDIAGLALAYPVLPA
jgi:gluconolactonase